MAKEQVDDIKGILSAVSTRHVNTVQIHCSNDTFLKYYRMGMM